MKQDVQSKTGSKPITKKRTKQKGIILRSRIKGGGFWEDMRSIYGMRPS